MILDEKAFVDYFQINNRGTAGWDWVGTQKVQWCSMVHYKLEFLESVGETKEYNSQCHSNPKSGKLYQNFKYQFWPYGTYKKLKAWKKIFF